MDKGLTCPVTAVSLGAALARHSRYSVRGTDLLAFTTQLSSLRLPPYKSDLCLAGQKSTERLSGVSVESVPGHAASHLNFCFTIRWSLPWTHSDAPSGQKQQRQDHGTLRRIHSATAPILLPLAPLFQCLQHLIIDSGNLMCQLGSGRASGKMSGSQGLSAPFAWVFICTVSCGWSPDHRQLEKFPLILNHRACRAV